MNIEQLAAENDIDLNVLANQAGFQQGMGNMVENFQTDIVGKACKLIKASIIRHEIYQTLVWTSALELFLIILIIVAFDSFGGKADMIWIHMIHLPKAIVIIYGATKIPSDKILMNPPQESTVGNLIQQMKRLAIIMIGIVIFAVVVDLVGLILHSVFMSKEVKAYCCTLALVFLLTDLFPTLKILSMKNDFLSIIKQE